MLMIVTFGNAFSMSWVVFASRRKETRNEMVSIFSLEACVMGSILRYCVSEPGLVFVQLLLSNPVALPCTDLQACCSLLSSMQQLPWMRFLECNPAQMCLFCREVMHKMNGGDSMILGAAAESLQVRQPAGSCVCSVSFFQEKSCSNVSLGHTEQAMQLMQEDDPEHIPLPASISRNAEEPRSEKKEKKRKRSKEKKEHKRRRSKPSPRSVPDPAGHFLLSTGRLEIPAPRAHHGRLLMYCVHLKWQYSLTAPRGAPAEQILLALCRGF